jgi:hypothetical protein
VQDDRLGRVERVLNPALFLAVGLKTMAVEKIVVLDAKQKDLFG